MVQRDDKKLSAGMGVVYEAVSASSDLPQKSVRPVSNGNSQPFSELLSNRTMYGRACYRLLFLMFPYILQL